MKEVSLRRNLYKYILVELLIMANINNVILIGYVGENPRIIQTQNGKKMATFSVATTEKGYTRQDGTTTPDKTDWHNIVVFGRIAEIVEKYLRKGSQVYVQGKLSYRQYEKDGQKRYVTEIIAENVQFLDRVGNNSENAANNVLENDLPF